MSTKPVFQLGDLDPIPRHPLDGDGTRQATVKHHLDTRPRFDRGSVPILLVGVATAAYLVVTAVTAVVSAVTR